MQKAGDLYKDEVCGTNFVRKVREHFINLLFPPRCPICDRPVRFGEEYICRECHNKPEIIQEPVCFCCGKPLAEKEQEYCMDCMKREHAFICGRALYVYESVQNSIYRFKYGGRQEYAAFYGNEMATYLSAFIRQVKADALVPVPISKARYRKRGYNQAELLAVEVGKQFKIPVLTHLVERQKNTLPQKGLNITERQKNLKKAFKIVQNDVKLNTIIMVDDIYTTGSTMDTLAKVLLSSGIQKIYFITLAITTGA